MAATLVAVVSALSACDVAPTRSGIPPSASIVPAATAAPTDSPASKTGGTVYLLTSAEQWNHIDPQRVYTREDIAFFSATIYRSLVSYVSAPGSVEGTRLTPDLATDLGRPTDGGRTWEFTLRDGVTFQTGAPITCEDIRYGVSRTFANNVISEGPTYAVQYLDVPLANEDDTAAGFLSHYHGPYESTPARQALFDQAVECSPDHRTITFHLNKPVAEFSYATTLGFSPVPKAADTGETYGTYADQLPVSSGPYMVESYKTGKGGRFVLVRNPKWDPASDPIRTPLPDRWEVEFAIDADDLDRRMIAAEGKDAFALQYGTVQPETAATIFLGNGQVDPAFADRALEGFDPYTRYYWINVENVPSLEVRQAMLVALDREAIRNVLGGEAFGSFADGVVKPTVGQDYAPTGIWDTFFGEPISESGDPVLARKLLDESGEPPPTLEFKIADTPTDNQVFDIVVTSLARAGFTIERAYMCPRGYFCSIVFDPDKQGDFGSAGWGADWPSASTVVPPLFTQAGGWDLSQVHDPAFDAAVDDALQTLDLDERAAKWQALHQRAIENAWVIPMFFGRQQRLAGTRVGPIYDWPAYASWPYRDIHVAP